MRLAGGTGRTPPRSHPRRISLVYSDNYDTTISIEGIRSVDGGNTFTPLTDALTNAVVFHAALSRNVPISWRKDSSTRG